MAVERLSRFGIPKGRIGILNETFFLLLTGKK